MIYTYTLCSPCYSRNEAGVHIEACRMYTGSTASINNLLPAPTYTYIVEIMNSCKSNCHRRCQKKLCFHGFHDFQENTWTLILAREFFFKKSYFCPRWRGSWWQQ